MRRFWNWIKNEDTGQRTLMLEGPIAEETWWGDEVTPKVFRSELMSGTGDITLWINSPGGDVEAAAQIYNMLMEYREAPNRRAGAISGCRGDKPGACDSRLVTPESGLLRRPQDDRGVTGGGVTVKIDGIAASAASVVAMAGGKVYMSPVSMLMIHNPSTIAIGDAEEMNRCVSMLGEYKESIINAYTLKTGQSRTKISHMMDAETWMNAHKAVELGFADEVLYTAEAAAPRDNGAAMVFSRMAVTNSLLDKFKAQKSEPTGRTATALRERLSLISH